MEFVQFPKIGRLSRECIVTEKLDGTNALVHIMPAIDCGPDPSIVATVGDFHLRAGSRTRWVTPQDDNYGFARWVCDRADVLVELGVGSHYGEWWGQGIQRKYGLSEKRFSLFNVSRWGDADKRPECCHVVPTLWRGDFDTSAIADALAALATHGSQAAPGFMKPEGVVVFHTQSGALFKKTLEKDDAGKGREPLADMAA